MKTNTPKKLFPIISLSLLALTSPMLGQEAGYQGSTDTRSSASTEMQEPAGAAADEGTNWSWLGLLGLLGLFGLKRRHEAHDREYRTAKA